MEVEPMAEDKRRLKEIRGSMTEQEVKQMFKETGLQEEEGWRGLFTRRQAEGAIENGTRFVKVAAQGSDSHPAGSGGIILGSIDADLLGDWLGHQPSTASIAYFVEFDDLPKVGVGISGTLIEPVADDGGSDVLL
jgi:hypothetical protein